jgi:hypothetical protein
MNDRMALFAAALIVAPIACHDERGAQSPSGASNAGAPATAPAPSPAPSTTSEPKGVEEGPQGPPLNDAPKQTDPSGTAPISRLPARPSPLLVAESGGTSPQGGYGGVGLAGAGGTIITTASR